MATKKTFKTLAVFQSIAQAVESLHPSNAAKEILQPKTAAAFSVKLPDGRIFNCDGDIRQALGVPHGKALKGLSLSGKDAEEEKMLENGRRLIIAYMSAILSSELSKRAFYTIAVIDKALDENGVTIEDVMAEFEITPTNGPALTTELLRAFVVIADAVAEFDGGYTSVRDIFSKADETEVSDIASKFNF